MGICASEGEAECDEVVRMRGRVPGLLGLRLVSRGTESDNCVICEYCITLGKSLIVIT